MEEVMFQIAENAINSNDLARIGEFKEWVSKVVPENIRSFDERKLRMILHGFERLFRCLESKNGELGLDYFRHYLRACDDMIRNALLDENHECDFRFALTEYPDFYRLVKFIFENGIITDSELSSRTGIPKRNLIKMLEQSRFQNLCVIVTVKIGNMRTYSLNERGKSIYRKIFQ